MRCISHSFVMCNTYHICHSYVTSHCAVCSRLNVRCVHLELFGVLWCVSVPYDTCAWHVKHESDMKHESYIWNMSATYETWEVHMHAHQLFVLSKEPCFLSEEPYFLSKEPCFLSKEPCFLSKETYSHGCIDSLCCTIRRHAFLCNTHV